MNPFVKKALVAVAAKQVLDKILEKREESRRPSRRKLVPLALVGIGGVAAFLGFRARQS